MPDSAATPFSFSEAIARAFHAHYEYLAPSFGYRTREESAKPWDEVPEANKRLMIGAVYRLLSEGVITPGPEVFHA